MTIVPTRILPRSLAAAFAAALSLGAVAQFPAGVHVVATRTTGAVATQLVGVDAATGQLSTFASFVSAALPPLALALDPFDRHLVVALDLGGNRSRIVRLVPVSTGLAELELAASVPGRVTQLAITSDDLYVTVDGDAGGLYRAPRRGGAPLQLVWLQPNCTAMRSYEPGSTLVTIAWTGRPGTLATESGVESIEAATAQTVGGAVTFANPTGRETTGLFDLPLGPVANPLWVLSFSDGTFGELVFGTLGSRPATPQPPAGGARAMKPSPTWGAGHVLGGASHPFLAELDGFSGAFVVRSAMLPGDPVDFAAAMPATAAWYMHAPECGPAALGQNVLGLPRPGSNVVLEPYGPPRQPVLLVAGFDDYLFGFLPIALPGSCRLDVAPDVLSWQVLDAAGNGRLTIAVPPGPQFLGAILFAQWAHLGASEISVSNAVSLQVGN